MAKHLAIIGSSGSGKSIFAAALAREVTKRKKRAIIVSGDGIIQCCLFTVGIQIPMVWVLYTRVLSPLKVWLSPLKF